MEVMLTFSRLITSVEELVRDAVEAVALKIAELEPNNNNANMTTNNDGVSGVGAAANYRSKACEVIASQFLHYMTSLLPKARKKASLLHSRTPPRLSTGQCCYNIFVQYQERNLITMP